MSTNVGYSTCVYQGLGDILQNFRNSNNTITVSDGSTFRDVKFLVTVITVQKFGIYGTDAEV